MSDDKAVPSAVPGSEDTTDVIGLQRRESKEDRTKPPPGIEVGCANDESCWCLDFEDFERPTEAEAIAAAWAFVDCIRAEARAEGERAACERVREAKSIAYASVNWQSDDHKDARQDAEHMLAHGSRDAIVRNLAKCYIQARQVMLAPGGSDSNG